MTKALFFDIDGTLVSFNTHRIPQSAVDALAEAKRRGAMVFISTGRPMRLINNLDAIQHLVDGYITANGACCSVGGEVIACREIPNPEARALIGAAEREGFAMLVVGESRLTVVNDGADVDRYFRQMLAVSDLGEGTALADVLAERIVQLTPIIDEAAERRLMPLLPSCVSARWFPAFTDITARGADKGTALMTVAAHLGIDRKDTVAFGDGGNDKSILQAAGTGVAMGNAPDDVKAVADYVTASVDEDGIARALEQLRII
ncbi:MAG TPA: Cof-type HAD-IIB family hydrolase [Candidatus Prevotella stercoripullorum]|nr:Cof-type HAD-IIB family hydrolase [Candidatus Prevotella stercoripullorum]